MMKYIIDKDTGRVQGAEIDAQPASDAAKAIRKEAFEAGQQAALEKLGQGRATVTLELESRTIAISKRAQDLYPEVVEHIERAAAKAFEHLREDLQLRGEPGEGQLDLLPGAGGDSKDR